MAIQHSLTLVVAFLCLLSTARCSSAEADAAEPLETIQLDEPLGRTFIQVNGSNIITTPNFVVGITLIGISLALLFGSAASAASVAAASTLAAGSIPPGKFKRSIPDSAGSGFPNAASLWKTLASVEQQFKNLDVTDVDCRKRIICEIHQETGSSKRLGSLSDVILNTFTTLSPDVDGDKYPFVKQYLEAANHGKAQKECSQVYNTCEFSVKNVLRNLSL